MKLNFKKMMLLFVVMFLLSGCTVNYNLKIDKKMKMTEEITASEDVQFNDLAHDFLLDRISVMFYDRYENNYEFLDVNEENTMGYQLTHEYESLNDFKENNPIFRDLIKNATITENNEIVSINMTISDDIYDKDDDAYIITPNNMNINIELPFKVTNHNASKQSGKTYTWEINENNKSADIILSFDKNRLSNHIYILNIGISYDILLLIGIIIVLTIGALYIARKAKGINKI